MLNIKITVMRRDGGSFVVSGFRSSGGGGGGGLGG